jgi:hypothetical protein
VAQPPWPRFLPDLTSWHAWHVSHDSLPGRWKNRDLSQICAELGVMEWRTVRPWRIELPGIVVGRRRADGEKVVTWGTSAGTLTAKWVLGPDGDWWQSEYPVKSRADFDAARLVVNARTYAAEPPSAGPAAGPPAGVLAAIELPRSPLPELFNSFLGWSEGLMLFLEEPDAVEELARILTEKMHGLLGEIAPMHASLAFAPDNLDARFITPDVFARSVAPLYARIAAALHAAGTSLVVHVGGPAASLLTALAVSGVDCAQGVCGAPQGDCTLAQARAACGPAMTLWGGIPQDVLLESSTREEFESAVRAAFAEAEGDPRAVVGVADRIPVEALPERLQQLARLAREASPREA